VPTRDVRIGIIGAGAVAQVCHIPAYRRLASVRLAAVCDSDLGKARRVAKRFGIPVAVEDAGELVSRDDVDAVDICTPNHLHAPIALAALRAGKHVLCEKPFTTSLKEAESVVRAGDEAERVVMCAFNNRFRHDSQVLRRFIDKGELGKVDFVRVGWMKRRMDRRQRSWVDRKPLAGGGVLMDIGQQILDLALWLLGGPKVETVTASIAATGRRDVEDSVAAFLRLSGGTTVTAVASWSFLTEQDVNFVEVFGTDGSAFLSPLRILKEMHGERTNVTPSLEAPRSLYRQSYEIEMDHFVRCVRDGLVPMSPGRDGAYVMRIVGAIYQSASSGREVRL
jgi:predicted dehydrogenase